MRKRSITAVLAAVPLFLTITAGMAIADQITNHLDGVVDATAEIMPLNAGGSAGATTLSVIPTNGDGKNGCNLTASTTLVVAVGSSNAAVATVSPSSITFTSCGDTPQLTVTPLTAGSTNVTLTQTSNNTGAMFDLAPATFTVNVTAPAPANTAPSISISGVTNGAQYTKSSLQTAICQVTDAEDGSSSFSASLSDITGPYASDGIGSQTASCSYTDAGGLTASSSVTYTVVDPSAPSVTYTLNPTSPDGENGWYKGEVSLTWKVSDSDSPHSLTTIGCDNQTVIADQTATDYTCTATSAGGSTGPVTATIQRDGTAPDVAYDKVVSGTLGDNGWYTSDVSVQFTAKDAFSGPATQSDTVSSEGEGQAIVVDSPPFTDLAGNTAPAGTASHTFMIDKTAPTNIQFQSTPISDGESYYYGSVPAVPSTCSATDDVSGMATCVVTGGDNPGAVGDHTLTATATNGAGLSDSKPLHYTVLAWTLKGFYAPVNMGDTWNTVKNGSTVPLKFEVFSDHELTDTSVVKNFTVMGTSCPNGSVTTDTVELTTTGGTNLRYDSTAGQFIQNWQTPKRSGACYTVTMTTQDGSAISAKFMLK